jgi:hypothetical protein
VERKGTKRRDLKKLLLQKKRPPRKKEGLCTLLLQAHMQIMRHGWLTQVHPHMTPHREWFYEYERYYRGNVFLGDDSTTRIIGRGKVKLKLIDGRIRTLPGVLHILGLARNLISVSKMDDAEVKTIC